MTESLLDDGHVRILSTDGKNDLADVDTSDSAIGFAPSAAHTGLQTKEYESERYTPRLSANQGDAPISTGAGQHLVDTQDVEGVDADPQMERVLAGGLRDVFVGADTGSLECLAGELLVLIGDEMAAEGELVHRGTLATEIKNTDLKERVSWSGLRMQ